MQQQGSSAATSRVSEAVYGHSQERVGELHRYHCMSDVALDEAISAQMVEIEEVCRPVLEFREQEVRDMEDLLNESCGILPSMEDELTEARQRWEAARATLQVAEDALDDMLHVQMLRESVSIGLQNL